MTATGTIERLPKSRARIWVKCPECGEERWAPYTKHQYFYTQRLCRECNTNRKRKFNLNLFPKNTPAEYCVRYSVGRAVFLCPS